MFVVFDLDGTLADDLHRQHHLEGDEPDWAAYFGDCVNGPPESWMICLLASDAVRQPGVAQGGDLDGKA